MKVNSDTPQGRIHRKALLKHWCQVLNIPKQNFDLDNNPLFRTASLACFSAGPTGMISILIQEKTASWSIWGTPNDKVIEQTIQKGIDWAQKHGADLWLGPVDHFRTNPWQQVTAPAHLPKIAGQVLAENYDIELDMKSIATQAEAYQAQSNRQCADFGLTFLQLPQEFSYAIKRAQGEEVIFRAYSPPYNLKQIFTNWSTPSKSYKVTVTASSSDFLKLAFPLYLAKISEGQNLRKIRSMEWVSIPKLSVPGKIIRNRSLFSRSI